jgi:ABC-2 type transport system ATP-binding protein
MPTPAAAPILEVRDLVKQFKTVRAVDGLSFDVRTGSCFGLLGPNGAGKSTTIEICEGLLHPTSGTVRYRGAPLGRAYREEVGIQFQSTALQDYLTVRENLRYFSALYPRRRPIDELIALCRLEDFLDRDTKKLSGGQRQRLLLALALVNDPDLLFLDEPTIGLDPQARRNFWDLITDLKRAGKTVVLTTHYMDEAALLCDEIVIVDRGRIIARGAPAGLLAERYDDAMLEVPVAEASKLAAAGLHGTAIGEHLEVQVADVNAAVASLLAAGVSLTGLRIRPRTLEDLFIELTGRGLRE